MGGRKIYLFATCNSFVSPPHLPLPTLPYPHHRPQPYLTHTSPAPLPLNPGRFYFSLLCERNGCGGAPAAPPEGLRAAQRRGCRQPAPRPWDGAVRGGTRAGRSAALPAACKRNRPPRAPLAGGMNRLGIGAPRRRKLRGPKADAPFPEAAGRRLALPVGSRAGFPAEPAARGVPRLRPEERGGEHSAWRRGTRGRRRGPAAGHRRLRRAPPRRGRGGPNGKGGARRHRGCPGSGCPGSGCPIVPCSARPCLALPCPARSRTAAVEPGSLLSSEPR